LEHVICSVIDVALAKPRVAEIINKHNPGFVKPSRPFLRMRYADAIEWLREHGIKNTEGNDHVFGDDM
jgi:asparaginyl-tRNA synthetase